MESTVTVGNKNRSPPGPLEAQQAVQHNPPNSGEPVLDEDSSNGTNNEASNYERRFSPSGQQLQQGIQQSLETGCQVKATKSVLFDTRSTTHAYNKKVQSGMAIFKTNIMYY